MQKFLIWAVSAVAALATVDLSSSLGKRDVECNKTNNKAQLDAGLNITQVDVSSRDGTSQLTFSPSELDGIVPGTVIQFNFWPKNHTVTESSFAEPCKPLAKNLTSDTHPGIRTGFVPVASANESSITAFRVMINDTKPIWLYCGQTNHCQKGMVMVINPNNTSGKTLQAYKDAAAKLAVSPAPGANSSSAVPPASSAPAVTPAPSTPATTTASDGPSLVSSTPSASSAVIPVFNGDGGAARRPATFAMVGGLMVAGFFASL